ncbi:MAG: glycosyltransferase family 4 protein [Vicinamibacterales bacterium]
MSAGWSRAIIMTPRVGGKDGVSAVTRLYAATLAERLGTGVDALEIWSLDDERQAAWPGDARVVFRGAAGRRLRFAALAAVAARVDERTLVIVQHLHLLPVALPLAWRGAHVVLLLHGVEAWKPLRVLERAGCHAAWKIAAVSAHTAARFRQANPALAGRTVEVCAPGLPGLPVAGNYRGAAPYALIVGRMAAAERYKGHDLLIDVWPGVCRAVPHARLVVVGGGDDEARLAAKAAGLGLDGAVRFEGVVGDERLAALYREATLFVMPSPGEGFGLVYVEAMSAGIPCIVAAGAAEEIVEHGRTGVVVPAGDGAALERAIVRLLTGRDERNRMGAAAAETARRRFGADAFARRLQHLLRLPPACASC